MPQSLLDLHVRPMALGEQNFVLSTWKHALRDQRKRFDWGKGLRDADYWLLANFVVDRITFPSCEVWMGCHPSRRETPECWVALRHAQDGWHVIQEYARTPITRDPELAAALHNALFTKLSETRTIVSGELYNPFRELKT